MKRLVLLVLLVLAGCAGVQIRYPDQSEQAPLWACWHEKTNGKADPVLTCMEFNHFWRILKDEAPLPDRYK